MIYRNLHFKRQRPTVDYYYYLDPSYHPFILKHSQSTINLQMWLQPIFTFHYSLPLMSFFCPENNLDFYLKVINSKIYFNDKKLFDYSQKDTLFLLMTIIMNERRIILIVRGISNEHKKFIYSFFQKGNYEGCTIVFGRSSELQNKQFQGEMRDIMLFDNTLQANLTFEEMFSGIVQLQFFSRLNSE